MSKMLPHHRTVLVALNECSSPFGEYCAHFKTIARTANMEDLREVRRITRHLARKGLAEYWRGLSTDEGEFAGAGYCVTPEGRALAENGVQP